MEWRCWWFQQMIDTGRFNQTSLAIHLGITPGQVSNRIRLLKLPDEFQQLIGSGQLPATHARSLVPWVDQPTVLQALKDGKVLDEVGELSVDEFEHEIAEAADERSSGMDSGCWNGPKFELTEEVRGQRDLQEVRELYGSKKVLRAFNVNLWDHLQEQAKAAAEEARSQRMAADDDGDDDTPQRDPARSHLSDYAIERRLGAHMSAVLAGRVKADAFGLRVFFLATQDSMAFLEWLGGRAGAQEDMPGDFDYWQWSDQLTPKNLQALIVEFLQWYLANDHSALSITMLKAICDEAKIFPFDKWQPDAELLDLCSDDQLRELFTDSMAPEKSVKKWGRARLLKEALESWPAGYLPALLTPRALMSPTHIGDSDTDEDDSDDDE